VSLDARLSRLTPGLTAQERGILVLGSLKNRTPEDPAWRSTMPREQTREFNRLISLLNACNVYLPLYITMVELRVEQLYLRLNWWHSVVSLGEQTWKLAQLVPVGKQAKAEAAARNSYLEAELPWEREARSRSWLDVSDAMEANVRAMLGIHWQDVRAIEIVLDEVAREFDGEDPLRTRMREILDGTKKKLIDLHKLLSQMEPFELQEPDEDAMDLARTYFEKGWELIGSL
jgi:hypothetical protein